MRGGPGGQEAGETGAEIKPWRCFREEGGEGNEGHLVGACRVGSSRFAMVPGLVGR